MISFTTPSVDVPNGCIVGVIEELSPTLAAKASCRVLRSGDALPAEAGDYVLDHCFSQASRVAKARGITQLEQLRRAGAAILLISHDEGLLEQCTDEIWWLRDGKLVGRGHPAEILPAYRAHAARELRASGTGQIAPVQPTSRQGDGRATLKSIELLGADGQASTVWNSGEAVTVRVSFHFTAQVDAPVIGILIRTRSGLNVYGTNTELEQLHPGPVAAGSTLSVTWKFRCELCPGDYTLTTASHDPDGLWHDWLEDAVAFAVSDGRYTAGVANLRARAYAEVTLG